MSRILGSPGRAEFTADTPITLNAVTRYWVVIDAGSGSGNLSMSTTASDEEDNVVHDTGATFSNWDIGDTMKTYDGSMWSSDSGGRSFRMALNGTTDPNPRESLYIGLAQVGVGVVAQIEDFSGRVRNESWQWQRGETSDGTFTDIPAEQGGTSGVYVPAAADLGKWLKANVSYDDPFGTRRSLSAVSNQPVLSQSVRLHRGPTSGYRVRLGVWIRLSEHRAGVHHRRGNLPDTCWAALRFGDRRRYDRERHQLDALCRRRGEASGDAVVRQR